MACRPSVSTRASAQLIPVLLLLVVTHVASGSVTVQSPSRTLLQTEGPASTSSYASNLQRMFEDAWKTVHSLLLPARTRPELLDMIDLMSNHTQTNSSGAPNGTVLGQPCDSAIDCGSDLRYSCLDGVCIACTKAAHCPDTFRCIRNR